MKYLVEYTVNNVECAMDIETEDLKAAKQVVAQWRVNKLKFRKDKIKIDKISPYKTAMLIWGQFAGQMFCEVFHYNPDDPKTLSLVETIWTSKKERAEERARVLGFTEFV